MNVSVAVFAVISSLACLTACSQRTAAAHNPPVAAPAASARGAAPVATRLFPAGGIIDTFRAAGRRDPPGARHLHRYADLCGGLRRQRPQLQQLPPRRRPQGGLRAVVGRLRHVSAVPQEKWACEYLRRAAARLLSIQHERQGTAAGQRRDGRAGDLCVVDGQRRARRRDAGRARLSETGLQAARSHRITRAAKPSTRKTARLCHGEDGQGQQVAGRAVFPPLWGPQSFNWGAGMHQLDNAAAFIKANMPFSRGNTLERQDAWDVAMFMNAHERPQDPRFTGDLAATRKAYHDTTDVAVWHRGQRASAGVARRRPVTTRTWLAPVAGGQYPGTCAGKRTGIYSYLRIYEVNTHAPVPALCHRRRIDRRRRRSADGDAGPHRRHQRHCGEPDSPWRRPRHWRLAFVLGLLVAPRVILLLRGDSGLGPPQVGLLWMGMAGLLVGLGTGIGSGCTSGHGVCGIARLSPRSLAATAVFMSFGVATVYVVRHLAGGL